MSRPAFLVLIVHLGLVAPGRGEVAVPLTDVKPHTIQMHRAQEAGLLETLAVKPGDRVEEGQVLARLEHERQLHAYNVAKVKADNQGGLMVAQGELQEKTAAFEEMQARYRKRQVSAAQVSKSQGEAKAAGGRYELARMNDELADLELALAEKMLERRFIRCRMKGTVLEVAKAPGDRVAEGDVVVTVADLNWITAVIPVTRESAAALANSAFLPIRFAGSTATRAAQIVGVTPMPNGSKGEQMVRLAFMNPDPLALLDPKAFQVVLPGNIQTAPIAKPPAVPSKPPAPKKAPGQT